MDSPIPHVEDVYFYSRENNILIANKTNGDKVPLVKFKQKFIRLILKYFIILKNCLIYNEYQVI